MKTRVGLAFLFTFLFSLSLMAAKAGKYEVTSTSTVDGKSYPMKTTFCLRQEHIDHPEKFAEGLSSHGCKISNFKAEKGVFSWNATCTGRSGNTIETSGSYTFHADSFEGHQTIKSDGKVHTIDQKAVWVSSQCDAIR